MQLFRHTALVLLTTIFLSTGLSLSTLARAGNLDGILLEKPIPLADFFLFDHAQEPFTRDRLKGKWSFVFFGYTHCPDVCPATMHEVEKLTDLLAPKPPMANQFQFIFVSVDPERDTPEHMAKYIQYFNPLILGVTGEVPELKNMTKKLKAKFSKGDGTRTEYSVNHSSAMYLINPNAEYAARFRAPHDVDRIYQWWREIDRTVNSGNKSNI